MTLRATPIHRAGNRPHLFLGGDREGVMFTGVLAFALVFAAQDWLATGFGCVLWLTALTLFRRMAQADPLLRTVYLRHRRYAVYFPARSTPSRLNRTVRR